MAADRRLKGGTPKILLLFVAALFLFVSAARAADEGLALMREGKWKEAEKIFAARAVKNASDAESRLNLGVCRLKLGDFAGADAALADAVAANPTFTDSVARAWKNEGSQALKEGKPDRALALYAKALVLTPSEAPLLGRELMEAAAGMTDETERARIVARAARWAGAEAAAEYTARYFRGRLGPARTTSLDASGWARIGQLRPGDTVYYLSTEPLRQKDEGTIRILPAAVELPVKLVIEEKDTKGKGTTEFWLGKHDKPAKVYFWLLPGGG